MALVVVVIAAASLAVAITVRSPGTGKPGRHLTALQKQELNVRRQAAAWLAHEVSHSTPVACDPAMCAAVEKDGYPGSELTVLSDSSPTPKGSDLVIETASVSTWFGTSFRANDAPMIVAAFGKGASLIEIRVLAPDGAAAYRSELRSDLANRKYFGGTLLSLQGKSQIAVSPTARTQMARGEVDMRVLLAIFTVAAANPVKVIDFGNSAAGASPGVPLRYVDLSEDGAPADMNATAYVKWLRKALTTIPYQDLRADNVKLHDGVKVLRVEFGAPTPLGIKQ